MKKLLPKSLFFLLFLTLLITGCSTCSTQTAEEKRNEELRESAEQLGESVEELATKIGENAEGTVGDAMKKLEEQVNKMKEDKDFKEPINFREMKALLPETLDGMTRSKHKGSSSGAMGFKVSQAEAMYKKDDEVVNITMIDAGGLGTALMGMAAWSNLDIDEESDDGYKRTVNFNGHKAYEECSKNNRDCQLSMIINGRFILTLEGDNTGIDRLRKMGKSVDMSDLGR